MAAPMQLPRSTMGCRSRPVSGLTSIGVSPSQVITQWLMDTPALDYRCGGSSGIA